MVLKKSNLSQLALFILVIIPTFSLTFDFLNLDNVYIAIRLIALCLIWYIFVFHMQNYRVPLTSNLKNLGFVYIYVLLNGFIVASLSMSIEALTSVFIAILAITIFYASCALHIRSKQGMLTILLLIYTLLLFLNVSSEMVIYNILGIDLGALPWSQVYSEKSAIFVFGNIDHNQIRIPTFYGLPHKTSLISAVLTLFWIHKCNIQKDSKYKILIYIAFATNVICFSRFITLCLIFSIYCYQRNLKRDPVVKLIFILFGVFAVYWFSSFTRLSASATNMEILYAIFNQQGIFNESLLHINFDMLPNQNRLDLSILALLTGLGDFYQAEGVAPLSFFTMEIGLIIEIIPKYGLLFCILALLFFFNIKKDNMYSSRMLIALTILLGLSTLHFSLIFRSGIIEIISLVYGMLLGDEIRERT